MTRRLSAIGLTWGFVFALFAAGVAHAADYPRRPINIIVPYKAGGGTDAYARALSAVAGDTLPVPLVVVNKAGSGGLNGAQSLVGARPDGYTLMLTSGGSLLLSTLTRNTRIDALDSFELIAQIGRLTTSLVVPANSRFKTVQDVIDAAKADPGSLRWAHAGRGGFHHVSGLGFLAANNLNIQDVPFKGGSPARAALIGEQVDFGFIGVQQSRGFEEQIRVLAVNAKQRDSVMDGAPSFSELGIPFADLSSPVLVFAPKNTPSDVLAILEKTFREITATPRFVELMSNQGAAAVFVGGGEARMLLARIKEDVQPLVRLARGN